MICRSVSQAPSAIRTLGTAIDTTVFNNAGAAIAKTIVDAKGDLIVATAADTVARLASSGTNGDLLTVDTSTASGLKWATPAGSGCTLITTLSPSSVSSVSADNVFSSTYDSYMIFGYVTITDNTNFECRFRNGGSDITTSTYNQDSTSAMGSAGSTWYICDNRGSNLNIGWTMNLINPGNSSIKMGNFSRTHNASVGTYVVQGLRNTTTSAFDGIKFFPSSGNMTGKIYIYGLAK